MNIKRRKISELKNDPANARKHSPRNLKAISDSLDVFGQQKPIVIDSRGVVIAGNGTLEAARELGWDEIAVAVSDLDPAHAQAFGIADNRTAELAEWDTDVLGKLLQGMDSDLADILSMDDLELPDSIDGGGQGEGLTDPDEVPEPPEEPITQMGDLWLLGEHRLLCGDSTSAEDVGRLMDGAKADLLLTDPPYGVKRDKGFGGEGGFRSANGPAIARRTYTDDWDAERPTQETFALLLSMCDRHIIFGGNYFADMLPQSTHWIVWDKNNTMPTFGDCELAWTSSDRKSVKKYECTYNGLIGKESDRFHPTQKPIKLFAEIIGDYSKPNELMFDPFLGSGTTLIAAEQLGRKCYGMETARKYCDVIVKRWEDFTGQTATRETASQTATRETAIQTATRENERT